MYEPQSNHEKAAQNQPHDSHGHFAKKPQSPQPSTHQNPLSKFFGTQTTISPKGASDDLLDVHIGNPLRRIGNLLEEIKRQKAFSFTLKGSLGVMGVVLVAATFGILGGSRLLCDKGTQSHIGTIKVLAAKEDPQPIPLIQSLLPFLPLPTHSQPSRVILIKNDTTTISIPSYPSVPPNPSQFHNQKVIITGAYDSCSQILKPNNSKDIELYTSALSPTLP